MISRRTALGAIASALTPAFAPGLLRAAAQEPEILRARVDSGALPAMAARLPKVPRVINLAAQGQEAGKTGGSVRVLISGQKDIRLMSINGYARLVGYDADLVLQPDILQSAESQDDRIFTFLIREGHRWSDGSPLTSEDFRHVWDDVLNNKDLRPGGLPAEMLSNGLPPRFEVLDTYTVRFSWDVPNPSFLPHIAAPQPLTLVMPAAYMKQFHARYADAATLAKLITQNRVQDWTDLYAMKSRSYRPENPDLPTLDPWRNTTAPPAEQFVFERNPYFHRVDENGVQLPYVDRYLLNVSSSAIISAKAGAGEADLQMVGLDFVDYTFLKAAEKIHPVKVDLWKETQGSILSLMPNLTCSDDVWRRLMQDVRVRRALSMGIDRHEINMVSFFGLAQESADTLLPESPLFDSSYATLWAQHDPQSANALLDEAGLDKRNSNGVRLLPDGRAMEIIIETASRSPLETDVLQLIRDHWSRIGVALFIRASQRDIFRSRVMSGAVVMSAWFGLDNAVATADMSPGALAPTADDQLQWPLWGMYYYSRHTSGRAPDYPPARKLLSLFEEWRKTTTTAQRTDIWRQMLTIRSDQVLTIGTVNGTRHPILQSSHLRNVPHKGLYGFEPTSYLGVYMPDTFWYDNGGA